MIFSSSENGILLDLCSYNAESIKLLNALIHFWHVCLMNLIKGLRLVFKLNIFFNVGTKLSRLFKSSYFFTLNPSDAADENLQRRLNERRSGELKMS